MAESLHPSEMADSFKYLFTLFIYTRTLSHSEERDLQYFSYYSSDLILLSELAFSWIIF